MADIVFVDTEVSAETDQLKDIGAVRVSLPVLSLYGREYHDANLQRFAEFAEGAQFLCGHNLIEHDVRYLLPAVQQAGILCFVDTLPMSPLLFPKKPYHRLLKDYKLQAEELNNPLCDAKRCMELYMDEVAAFQKLPRELMGIYSALLRKREEFKDFFGSIYPEGDPETFPQTEEAIRKFFSEQICENADLTLLVREYPVELSYALAAISADDRDSLIPGWVLNRYPKVTRVMRLLRGTPCEAGCPYCESHFSLTAKLREKFGYPSFRTYNGVPLQEQAARAALENRSLLAIFPTGGGKSITFQLPALIDGETQKGLTVVISPLQSLMKDQVDNLEKKGISDAVTVNGLLSVLERKEAFERVESGIASILYISPESLRSRTIERLLSARNVTRFVIDEAHCFSSWGQDFRVDYLYIGDFIAKLQKKLHREIPVSCFTATAKQKVVSDIRDYFREKLNVDLQLFTTDAARTNLRYQVIHQENREEKYKTLRRLIDQKNCPTIVYTSRTKRTEELAKRLNTDGYSALPYHGKMDQEEKVRNQEAFLRGEVPVIVATSAFGMGVDKPDVRLVVHFDISDSLENYVQEAGRAGRDEKIEAECYILFNEADLDGHFTLLNQTKLTINEIQQIWRGIKLLSGRRTKIFCSALDLAKSAGWPVETVTDLETKVHTAVNALEMAGYIERGNNSPRVYADSIMVKNVPEARERMDITGNFLPQEKEKAVVLLQTILSSRSRDRKDPVTYVDYLGETLGYEKAEVIRLIDLLKQARVLSDEKELAAFLEEGELRRKGGNRTLNRYFRLEHFLMEYLEEHPGRFSYKEINELAAEEGLFSDVKMLKEIITFWTIRKYMEKPEGEVGEGVFPVLSEDTDRLRQRLRTREMLCDFIDQTLISDGVLQQNSLSGTEGKTVRVDFSTISLMRRFNAMPVVYDRPEISIDDMEEALLYLCRTKAFRIEGGFLMMYNRMEIQRLEKDNRIQYKKDDYKKLEEFYHLKTQQIHIVGEYANMILRDYAAALAFVYDYFQMDYQLFLKKYFQGSRAREIERNITPEKYDQLFQGLTERQTEIINDDASKVIVVAAGPGSGKTKILVHKLASLLLMEDVKYEQLLMLTFSRAAAVEFKSRLYKLIGNAARYVEIKTFHSYAFDLLGRVGSIEKSEDVVRRAARLLAEDRVITGRESTTGSRQAQGSGAAPEDRIGIEESKITKTVLVLDEAQDMNKDEYDLVRTLRARNDDMRIIAVGDDDQCIYQFRGSDSRHMCLLSREKDAGSYELVENFRSNDTLVKTANAYLALLQGRMKKEALRSGRGGTGEVTFTYYEQQTGIELETVYQFQHWYDPDKKRSTAILTTTNEQGYLIYDLLYHAGHRPRLIREANGFSLYNLVEFRFFADQVRRENEPRIEEAVWKEAVKTLKENYAESENLEQVLYTLERFLEADPKPYYNDLLEFLKAGDFNDFYRTDAGEICISTIHKSKGHEFEDVYLVLSNYAGNKEEKYRAAYVGMTRAKERLHVIFDTDIFGLQIRREFETAGAKVYKDGREFPSPEEIMLPMGMTDVWLEYTPPAKGRDKLIAGQTLGIEEDSERLYFLNAKNGRVAAASRSFMDRLALQRERGYEPVSACLSFLVIWKKQETEEERIVPLPRLILRKNKQEA